MKNIYLYGEMAEKFGPVFHLDVDSAMEAFRFLGLQIPEFRDYVSNSVFNVLRGNGDTLVELNKESLSFPLGSATDLHIVPVVAGGSRGGVKIIIGAIIMVAAVVAAPYTGGTSLAGGLSAFEFGTLGATAFMFGASLVLSGISQMLAHKPSFTSGESADQRASFFLGGQVNQVQQGVAIPLVYGRVRIGSTVISAGLNAEQIDMGPQGQGASSSGGLGHIVVL